jgi:hypothetical protein
MPNGWHTHGPGRGPYAHLLPWKRPGWLYGRGTCWWRGMPLQPMKPEEEIAMLTEQKAWVEKQQKATQGMLQQIQERIDKLKTQQ